MAVLTALFLTSCPVGIPGIWAWQRYPFVFDLTVLIRCLLFFGTACFFAWNMDFRGRGRKYLFLILLCGALYDGVILTSGRAGLTESAVAILNPFTTGYLNPRWSGEDVTGRFAETVLSVPAGMAPHHRHVHPPGNILLAKFAEHCPGQWGRGLLSGTWQDLMQLKRDGVLIAPLNTEIAMEAALKLLVMIILALELGKAILAFCMFRISGGQRFYGAGGLVLAFGTNPALLFLGHYDTLYFFPAALLLWTILRTRDSCWWSVPAGILTGIEGTLSLGFGAVGGLALYNLAAGRRDRLRKMTGFAAGGLAVLGLSYVCRIDLFGIFWKCWQNQQLFMQMSGRTYWIGITLNLLDALLFCGFLPCAAILFPPESKGRGRMVFWTGALAFWFFMLFSGGARGEFGRLAILYMPVLLVWLAEKFSTPCPSKSYILRFAAVFLMLLQTLVLRNLLKLILIDGA